MWRQKNIFFMDPEFKFNIELTNVWEACIEI